MKVHSEVTEIYNRTGEIDKHEEGIKLQYDTDEKMEFYSKVMGDGTDNIHFGKWDNIDLEQSGAYGKAAEQMTDYMFDLGCGLLPSSNKISYVDLGSGTGAAGLRLTKNNSFISKTTCLNLCESQNSKARERAVELGLDGRISVVTGTYDEAPFEDDSFDLAFSQDAFVHSFSKKNTYKEALRIVKEGGVFILCDLMCGNGPDVAKEELATFAATNMVNDWVTPEENVVACQSAGWSDVKFVDMTTDIRISFLLMLKKVEDIIGMGGNDLDPVLLSTYKDNLAKRVGQVDRGVFKWGVIHAKKPLSKE